MSVCCKDLFQMRSLKEIKLVAGEGGLDRKITWAYIGENTNVSEYGIGGELLFITGIGMDRSDQGLMNLIENCNQSKFAGLVISVSEFYIKDISKPVADYAESLNFPVFTIPWNVKRIDVMKELSYIIVNQKQKSDKKVKLLNIMTSDVSLIEKSDAFNEVLKSLGVEIDSNCRCIAIVIETYGIKKKELNKKNNFTAEKLKNTFFRYKMVEFQNRNNMYLLIFGKDIRKEKMMVVRDLESAVRDVYDIEKNKDIYLGISFGEADVLEAVYRAENAVGIYKAIKKPGKIAIYEELGFFRIIYQDIKNPGRKQYCLGVLNKFIEYDDARGEAFMLDTMVAYYENMFNISKTAEALYIHRNSLMYRFHKIEELTGLHMENPYEVLDVIYCAIAYKYFIENQS